MMTLVYRNFSTPSALVEWVNTNKIRPEQIQFMNASELMYWDNISMKVSELSAEYLAELAH